MGFGTANIHQNVVDRSSDVAPATWETVSWLKGFAKVPVVLKGITTVEDAALAMDRGVDGLIVSNHGGRVMDTMPAAIEMLPSVVAAVGGRAEVYLDSGVRRGADVLKALALGARAVGIGRPLYWGLAVGGARGVHGVIEVLRAELDSNLACCGQTDVTALGPNVVNVGLTPWSAW
jgi:4-hydroxymandelate oxidase